MTESRPYVDLTTILPPSQLGTLTVEHRSITKHDADLHAMRSAFAYGGSRHDTAPEADVPFVVLLERGTVWMSDVPMERGTNRDFVRQAHGDVLIGGLGLGLIVAPLLATPEVPARYGRPSRTVRSVTVIERNPDVAALIGPHLDAYRARVAPSIPLRIVVGDVYDHAPVLRAAGETFDTVYFDVWPTICGDNWPQMKQLHRAYRSRLRDGGRMTSWEQETCRYHDARWRTQERRRSAFFAHA